MIDYEIDDLIPLNASEERTLHEKELWGTKGISVISEDAYVARIVREDALADPSRLFLENGQVVYRPLKNEED